MTWLSFLKKRQEKKGSASEWRKIFFLKQTGTKLYVHPAGKHLFDNSAYALKEGKVGAICVYEEQTKAFFEMFLQDGIELTTEEISPC